LRGIFPQMQETDLADTIGKILLKRDKRADNRNFRQWCNWLLSTLLVRQKVSETNFKVDIELQPLRWMRLGILLLQSRKGVAPIQLAGGFEGPPMKTYLPYPVFQLATGVFLKGIWPCQFPECRTLQDHSYVNVTAREARFKQLQNRLGHDLARILNEVRKIHKYRKNAPSMRFFDLIERIVALYYFPLFQGANIGSLVPAGDLL